MGLKGEEPSPDPPHLVSWGLPVDDDHVLQYDSATAAYGSVPAAALHSLYSKQHSRSSIPHRQPRTSLPPASLSDAAAAACGAAAALQCPPWRPPTTSTLFKLLMGAIATLVLVQVLSCGLFFCVRLPSSGAHYVDLLDLFTEFSVPHRAAPSALPGSDLSRTPKLIPRILHQTYASTTVPATVRPLMQSWRLFHPEAWQTRFYDNAACDEFVAREFPEYVDAYRGLPKAVERSDFFRYMVVLRLGGVYADVDVEFRQPLDAIIRASDTMIVGWESEVPDDAQSFKRHFVRKRQVLQWFFAASPGHPVLRDICNHIATNVNTVFSNNSNRDTLDRTGPGAWTDAVLRHATAHPASELDNPWNVRILPRVAFGVHPAGIDGLTPDLKEIIALHHFLGSWKKKGGWRRRRTPMQVVADLLARLRRVKALPPAEEPIRTSAGITLFPVSVAVDPPFTLLVDLIGHGDLQAGLDVSAVLTSWGTYQAGLSPSRHPSVVEALIGSLGTRAGGDTLVDVGAAHGFFSLAAAARGHKVISFEASAPSLAAFSASVAYNGFGPLVTLHNVSLGAAEGSYCAERGVAGNGAAPVAPAPADADTRRGYGDAAQHASAVGCTAFAPRQTLSTLLASVDPLSIGALRISASGWEAQVLDGAADFLSRHRPGLILLEYTPALMARAGDRRSPSALLHHLHSLGYLHVAHAGYVCDERWSNITRALGGAAPPAGSPATSQSTWCNLKPEHFHLIGERAHDEVPENLLFIHEAHGDVADGSGGADAAPAGGGADPVPADGNATSAGGGGGGGSVSSGGAVASSNVASVGADGGGGGAAASSSVAASSDGGAVTSAVGGGVAGGTVVSGGGAAAVGTSSGPVDAAVLHSNASAATRAGHGNAAGNSSAALPRTVSRGAAVADGARR